MEPELLEALRRNSGLRLDREGRFYLHERPVENERVQALFHRSLRVRVDGEVTLHVGEQWAYVTCASAAHFVDALRIEGGEVFVRYRHRDGEAHVDPYCAFGPDDRCYLWARVDGPPAILGRAAHGVLTTLLEEHEGHVVIPSAGSCRPVVMLSENPTAGMPWPG